MKHDTSLLRSGLARATRRSAERGCGRMRGPHYAKTDLARWLRMRVSGAPIAAFIAVESVDVILEVAVNAVGDGSQGATPTDVGTMICAREALRFHPTS